MLALVSAFSAEAGSAFSPVFEQPDKQMAAAKNISDVFLFVGSPL